MADVKLLIPQSDSENLKKDVEQLKTRFTAVLKELEYLLCNLDEENVTRAASVYAENIDTRHAKISDAQIGELSADKLTSGSIDAKKIEVKNLSADAITSGTIDAGKINVENLSADSLVSGTLDTEQVTVASGDGRLVIYDTVMAMYDASGTARLVMGLDTRPIVNGEENPNYNVFRFDIADESGAPCIQFDSNGNAVFSGIIDTKSNVNIGNRLKLMNAYGEGGVFFCTRNGSAMASVMCESFESGPGVMISADEGLYVNGSRVATEEYVAEVIRSVITGGAQTAAE